MKLASGLSLASINEVLGNKYLLFKVFAIKEFGYFKILHACLANSTSLKVWRFPHTQASMFLRCIHLCPSNPCRLPFLFLLTPKKTSKQAFNLIEHCHWNTETLHCIYVGRACATDLIKISLPACDKNPSFHPFSFFSTLS